MNRRSLLTATAASVMLPGVTLSEARTMSYVRGSDIPPDADLIAACAEYLRIQRKWSAYCASFGDKDIEADDPGLAILDSVAPLVEQIVALRATTAEGHAARAQCMTFAFLPSAAICRDNPDGAAEDRFKSAMYRDLVHAEQGAAV